MLLREEFGGVALDGIARMWREASGQPPLLGRLVAQGRRLAAVGLSDEPGYRVFDRRVLEKRHQPSQPGRPNYLARLRQFALDE